MTARRIFLLGAVAALTLAGTRPGMAEGSFDSVSDNATTQTDKAAATVSSEADIADDGLFTLTASAHQAEHSIDGMPARALGTAVVTNSFTLTPGDYKAEVYLHDLEGWAIAERLGQAGSSFSISLDCAVCTWEGGRVFDIISTLPPAPDQMRGGSRAAALPFTVNEDTTVSVTVEILAGAVTGNGIVYSELDAEPVTTIPSGQVYAHGGGGDTMLTGIIDPVTVSWVPPHE